MSRSYTALMRSSSGLRRSSPREDACEAISAPMLFSVGSRLSACNPPIARKWECERVDGAEPLRGSSLASSTFTMRPLSGVKGSRRHGADWLILITRGRSKKRLRQMRLLDDRSYDSLAVPARGRSTPPVQVLGSGTGSPESSADDFAAVGRRFNFDVVRRSSKGRLRSPE